MVRRRRAHAAGCGALAALGGGQTLSFTFHEAATKYVRLVVTDALGVTATVQHNMVIAADPPQSEPPTEMDPPTETEQPKTEPPREKEVPKTEPPIEKEKPKTEPPAEKEAPKTEPPPSEPPVEKEHPKTEPPTQTDCINVPSACGYP